MTRTKSRKIGAVMVFIALVFMYLVFKNPGFTLPWKMAVTYGIMIGYVTTTTFFFIAPFRVR